MELLLGLIIGMGTAVAAVFFIKFQRKKREINTQSVVLLEKIKSVFKLITVEGDFAEIFHHQDTKRFAYLFKSSKSALIIVHARAHVGFDFSKVKLHADNSQKKIILQYFPQPEILSVETDMKYYDKKEGHFNKFKADDLTEINHEAKEFVKEKIPESGLYTLAGKEALESLKVIENIVQTIGWKLDYSEMERLVEKQKLPLRNREY